MKLAAPVDLPATLLGGQAFRWRRAGDAFVGIVGDAIVRLTPRDDGAIDASASPARRPSFFKSYLRIEPSDAQRRARLARDPILAPALAAHPGLRLLRQDPWETTAAFLTSANNNVLRIEGILERLSERYGEPIEGGAARAFPAAERLARAREIDLRACGLGYRAPFLKATARAAARDVDLAALRGRPLEECLEALEALPGIGPKVASCIALFSLDADDAFPVDRWVLRAVSDALLDGRDVTRREAETVARERWGDDAGLAQQYLFHAVRMRAGAPGTRRLADPKGLKG